MATLRPYMKHYNAETGEFSAEYRAYEEGCIAAGATDFDCNQVARAMDAGLSPEAAAAQFNADAAEEAEDFRRMRRSESVYDGAGDFDYSMNG